ncbi:unnamed protein product, partial [Meganyctiphanes norvegica]
MVGPDMGENMTEEETKEEILYRAVPLGDVEKVTTMIEAGADVNYRSSDGRDGETPLWVASKQNNSEIVQILLANNADVNKIGKDGQTPINIASENGHSKIVQLLLANNADVNKEDKYGK